MSNIRNRIPRQLVEVVAPNGEPLQVDGAKLDELLARIGTPDDDPGDNTVIGQLKQIAQNTAT